MAAGSIIRRGKTWSVRYDEPGETGRRQRRKGGFATRREAQAFLNDVMARLGDGSYTAPSRLTVAAYLDEWQRATASTVRPSTVEKRRAMVGSRIVPGIGQTRLQALSGARLNAFYAELAADGLSAGTIRNYHTLLSRACRDAVRWGYLPRNPVELADPPRMPRSRATAWTANELSRFLAHVRDADPRRFPLWRLAGTTGMRRGELLGLTWRALDLERSRLSVEQQLIPTRGGASFGPPKSARSRRTIALDSETVDVLRRHREAQLLERDLAAGAYEDHDLVFCDEIGQPIHPQTLSRAFTRRRKEAGLPTGSLHVLRHTAATLALTATPPVPLHIVAARLGDHPKTTLATYAHLLPSSDEVAAERVAAAID
jgi:integrase